ETGLDREVPGWGYVSPNIQAVEGECARPANCIGGAGHGDRSRGRRKRAGDAQIAANAQRGGGGDRTGYREMIEDDAPAADRLARAAHGHGTGAARQMRERAGTAGREISRDVEARVARGRGSGAANGQVIEIVGAGPADERGGAREGHRAGAAGISSVVGPVSSDRVCKGTSIEGG